MKSTANTEGLDVSPEIIKAFKNFKQGSILEKSYFRFQHEVGPELEQSYEPAVLEKIIKEQSIRNLSTMIYEKFGDQIESKKKGMETIYSIDALMMPMKDFKHAVEYVIRTMPMSAIEDIRK